MTISPQQTPTGGNPDGKRRSPHHSTSPLGSDCVHSPLREKGRRKGDKHTQHGVHCMHSLCQLILSTLTVDHHVISNNRGCVESSFSGTCCWETGLEGCPKPSVHVEHIGAVHPHAEPMKKNTQQG